MNAVVQTIEQLNCHGNMNHGNHSQFMVILGDVGGKKEDNFEELIYTPYLYKDGQFERQSW